MLFIAFDATHVSSNKIIITLDCETGKQNDFSSPAVIALFYRKLVEISNSLLGGLSLTHSPGNLLAEGCQLYVCLC